MKDYLLFFFIVKSSFYTYLSLSYPLLIPSSYLPYALLMSSSYLHPIYPSRITNLPLIVVRYLFDTSSNKYRTTSIQLSNKK